MRPKPLLSILIPTHKRENLLKETIESILSQKTGLESIEVIISNDASKDGTQLYLENFLETNKKFALSVFHHEKNLGGPLNWKFLLSKAQGEFVYLLSDDDTIKPNFLEKYFSIIKNHPQVDLIYSGIEYCDDHMKPLSQSRISSVPGLVSGKERLKNQLIANHMVMSSIYRRETFVSAGGWQEKYHTCLDGAAFAHMCKVSEWTYFIEESLFSFRLGSQTWSSFKVEKQKKQYQSFRLLIDDILIWAKKQDSKDLKFYKKCYAAHAQGVLNMLDLKMVHNQLTKNELSQLLRDLVDVFPEARRLNSFYKMKLVSYFGVSWLQRLRQVLGKKDIRGTSVFEKEFSSEGEKQWV